jgi:Flp pilus assembly protein TadG
MRLLLGKSGQGTVEWVILILVFAIVMFGAFEMAQGVGLKHQLDVGAEKAARQLAINPSDYAAAERTIRAEVDANFLGGGYGSQVIIGLYDADTLAGISPAQLATAPFGYRFLVAVQLDWQAFIPFVDLGNRTLTCVHQGTVERIP